MAEAAKVSAASQDQAAATRDAAIRDAARKEEPKHRRLLRSSIDGRVLSALMLPLIAIRPPAGYAVLTTTGRKSGKKRRKCIRAIRRGDKAFIVQLRPPALAIERPDAVAGWVWNLRANPDVRLRLGRRTYAGVAREIEDPGELEQAREAICETVHLTDYDECALHMRGFPTREKIRALHCYWFDTGTPLVVELSHSRTSASAKSESEPIALRTPPEEEPACGDRERWRVVHCASNDSGAERGYC